MKVVICTPVYADTKAHFTVSLVNMVAWTYSRDITYNGSPTRPDIQMLGYTSSRIDLSREILAGQALAKSPDYILWMDADHLFPPETLVRLMAHDRPIVGCNYPKRHGDERISSAAQLENGDFRPIAPKPDGLEAVAVVGFGVCLIKAEVFKALPRPWFKMGEHGEDGYFCQQAKAHGIQPYVDHALSMEVGHIAETVLTFPR